MELEGSALQPKQRQVGEIRDVFFLACDIRKDDIGTRLGEQA